MGSCGKRIKRQVLRDTRSEIVGMETRVLNCKVENVPVSASVSDQHPTNSRHSLQNCSFK